MSKCSICRTVYQKRSAWQKVCGSVECAIAQVTKDKKAKADKVARAEKAVDREKKEANKTKPQLLKDCQKAFNAYIRARDYGLPCICCNEPIAWGTGVTGGVCDAGHYLSVGAHPSMRFNEENVHAQRKYCNKQRAGNSKNYRDKLIIKIGLTRVEALESDNTPRKYSKEDLRAMTVHYKGMIKTLTCKDRHHTFSEVT